MTIGYHPRSWPNYPSDYRPLLRYAKANQLAVLASNAPRRHVGLVGRAGQAGLAALPPASKEALPPLPIPPPSASYRQIFHDSMCAAVTAQPPCCLLANCAVVRAHACCLHGWLKAVVSLQLQSIWRTLLQL